VKLLFFDDFKLGALKGDAVVDVSDVVQSIPHIKPQDLISGLIERFSEFKGPLEQAIQQRSGVPVSGVKIRPPLPRPTNIVCMAVNYMEDGTRAEPAPINAFLKTPNCVIGDGETIELPDTPGTIFECEGELALVIGKRAKNVPAAEAMDYIFGYINFIDGSARGLPPSSNTYYLMKSRDTFGPMGPYLVTTDDVPDPNNLRVRVWVNGEVKQDYNTSDMAHKIPRCIEWITSCHTLEPGDVISLGTNHGGLHPFQDGDTAEIEVEGLGRLHMRVHDELKRSWARETRHEREAKGQKGPTPQLTGKYAPAATAASS